MGVKSTVTLTRAQAEERYIELLIQEARRRLRTKAAAMSDKQLEDVIEVLNDSEKGGEGFENYQIREEGDPY